MVQMKTLGIATVALALVWWATVVLWGRKPAPVIDTTTSATTSSSGISITTTPSSASSSYTVSVLPLSNTSPASVKAPSLSRSVAYSAGLSSEAKQILAGQIAKLREALSKNANDFSAWMNLALRYKGAGDYEGAREVWEYTTVKSPGDSRSPHNLGDLYHHFLNDFVKAEKYYLLSISSDPTVGINYLALHELYRDSYKRGTADAADILKKGIANVAGDQVIDMYGMLGSYYRERGDAQNAIIYLTYARDAAEKAGNTMLVAEFNDQLSALKK